MSAALREALPRAATLDERLRAAPKGAAPGARDEARWNRWARYLANGDEAALERRLSWDGLTRGAALAALGEPPPFELELPALAEALAHIEEHAAASVARMTMLREVAGEPLPPFASFATALLRPAAQRVAGRCAAAGFSAGAIAQLEASGVRSVATLLQYATYQEFRSGRAGAASYDAFLASILRREGAESLFAAYPFAARSADLLVAQYERNAVELCERLDAAREALSALFDRDLSVVAAIRPALSDRHDGGRQVAVLEFASGCRIVYKPRAVALFSAFQRLLEWFEREGFDAVPPRLRVLDRGSHGWIEYAEQGEPSSAAVYFERAGALLLLTWLVSARDLHMDNVVATARGPVAVDLEAIFTPAERPGAPGTFREAQTRIGRSALGTNLLTFAQLDAEGRVYEAGGLCGRGGHLAAAAFPVWAGDGNDALQLAHERRLAPQGANVATIDGVALRAEDHAGAIVRGFRAAYRFALARRDALLQPGGPIDAFRGSATRVVLRPSDSYAAVHAHMLKPSSLQDGVEASLVVEALNRPFASDLEPPRLWPLAREERDSVLAWDVPLFVAGVESRDVVSRAGEAVRDCFGSSGFEVVVARIGSLDARDEDFQSELIAAALASPALPALGDRRGRETGPLQPGDAIEAAAAIADLLWSRAVRGDDGGVAWIGSRQLRMDGRADRGVSHYLFDGSPGVALLFAALFAVTGDPVQRERAAACMRSTAAAIRSPRADVLFRHEGIGALSGIGSIVVALVAAYRLTGDEDHLALAGDAARLLTGERIAGDTLLDIEGGAAGALVALLQLHAFTGDRDLLVRAAAAAGLLAERSVEAGGGRGWPSPGGPPLAGYAHGAAGIAAALARYAAVTGTSEPAALAQRALVFERSVWDPARRNWPVLSSTPPLFMTAWCHGAAGGALARAAMRDVVGGADLDREIAEAAACVNAAGAASVDHLCCGTMGRVDALLAAASALARPDLHDAASRLAASVVAEARAGGGFTLFPPPHHRVLEAGLFRGLAGIGYELLRVARPAEIPSVLSFAAPVSAAARSQP